MLNDITLNENLQLPKWATPAINLFNQGKINHATLWNVFKSAILYTHAMANLDESNESTIRAAQSAVIGKQVSIESIKRASI